MRLSKEQARNLFDLGVMRYGVHGRDAHMQDYPYKDHPYYGAHAAQAYLGGVKAHEFGHNRDEELRDIL